MKRPAFGAFLGPVPLEVWGLVEPGGGELNALGVSGVREFGKRDRVTARVSAVIGEDDFGRFALQSFCGEGGQSFPELAAGIGDCHSVEVGTGGGRGG